MKFDINKSLEILHSTPLVLEKQLSDLSRDWFMNNEGEGTWTPAEIICHLIHCEEEDWTERMKIILSDEEDKKFKPFNRTKGFEKSKTQTIKELLTEFKLLRKNNLKYLKSLKLSDSELSKTGIHPDFGEVTLGQLLATWVVHDLSHIAQISRVMANQYADEVGPWSEYLPILKIKNSSDTLPADTPDKRNWSEYYKNKSNLEPRETLVKVMELFEKENSRDGQLFAIDIGCGHGVDTLYLLKKNWKVLAIDKEAEGLKILSESVLPSHRQNFRMSMQSFEDLKLGKCNLLNASYCIPFCKPEYFYRLWDEIENSILRGGRFAGNFFGLNDSWAINKAMTFLSETDVRKLFTKFTIEIFEERDEDGTTAIGETKHWHVYSVIARKI